MDLQSLLLPAGARGTVKLLLDGKVGGVEEKEEQTAAAAAAVDSLPECPICLEPSRAMVDTNCGHIFCASCVVQLIEAAPVLSAAHADDDPEHHPALWGALGAAGITQQRFKCPLCRGQVRLLAPDFNEDSDLAPPPLSEPHQEGDSEDAEESDVAKTRLSTPEERRAVLNTIRRYNRWAGAQRVTWRHTVRDLPFLWRRFAVGMSDPEVRLETLFAVRRWQAMMHLILISLYLVSPIDLLSERYIGVVGIVDDVFFLALFLIFAANLWHRVFVHHGGAG